MAVIAAGQRAISRAETFVASDVDAVGVDTTGVWAPVMVHHTVRGVIAPTVAAASRAPWMTIG